MYELNLHFSNSSLVICNLVIRRQCVTVLLYFSCILLFAPKSCYKNHSFELPSQFSFDYLHITLFKYFYFGPFSALAYYADLKKIFLRRLSDERIKIM